MSVRIEVTKLSVGDHPEYDVFGVSVYGLDGFANNPLVMRNALSRAEAELLAQGLGAIIEAHTAALRAELADVQQAHVEIGKILIPMGFEPLGGTSVEAVQMAAHEIRNVRAELAAVRQDNERLTALFAGDGEPDNMAALWMSDRAGLPSGEVRDTFVTEATRLFRLNRSAQSRAETKSQRVAELEQENERLKSESAHFEELMQAGLEDYQDARARVVELEQALRGIVEIGKRDLSNPKYDDYFAAAERVLRPTPQPAESQPEEQ